MGSYARAIARTLETFRPGPDFGYVAVRHVGSVITVEPCYAGGSTATTAGTVAVTVPAGSAAGDTGPTVIGLAELAAIGRPTGVADGHVHGTDGTAKGRTVDVTYAPFPEMPADILADETVRAMADVAHAAGRDPGRYVLTSVLLRGGRAVATDRFRMAAVRIPDTVDAVVPLDVVEAIAARGVTDVRVGIGDGRVHAHYVRTFGTAKNRETFEAYVAVPLVQGTYPGLDGILPADMADANAVLLGADVDAVRQLGKAAGGKRGGGLAPTRLTVDGKAWRGTVTNGHVTAERPVAELDVIAELPDVAVNWSYLADAFDHVGDGAAMHVRDGLKAIAMGTADGSRMALVMPMRA